MRELSAEIIRGEVSRLCREANLRLPDDISCALREAQRTEPWPVAKDTLDVLCDNMCAAKESGLPVCQDTGMACVFLEIGQDVHITGDLYGAINAGVADGYVEGYLRKSVVADPLRRVNTENNTPALITVDLVPGDKVKLTVAPKGFGSENMSRLENAQACGRCGWRQGLRYRNREACRGEPLPADYTRCRHRRQL